MGGMAAHISAQQLHAPAWARTQQQCWAPLRPRAPAAADFHPPSRLPLPLPQPDGESNALKFSQVFHLMPVGSSFVVTNDMFRLNYG